MSDIYVLNDDLTTTVAPRVRYKNKEDILQLVLEKNFDLILGDQITPDGEPLHWILIEQKYLIPREYVTQELRYESLWDVDFLLADQDAIPTFVDCTHYLDIRSRREMVGKLFDCIVNGSFHWNAKYLKDKAEYSAAIRNISLKSALSSFGHHRCALEMDDYFKAIETNLRKGDFRIVFVVDESSVEMRSIVDYLSSQLANTEVLLLEIAQFRLANQIVTVPNIYGRGDKRCRPQFQLDESVIDGHRKCDLDTFFTEAKQKLNLNQIDAIKRVILVSEEHEWDITWGPGNGMCKFHLRIPQIARKPAITIWADGDLVVNYGWLNENVSAKRFRDSLSKFYNEHFERVDPEDYGDDYQSVEPANWMPKVEELLSHLRAQTRTDLQQKSAP